MVRRVAGSPLTLFAVNNGHFDDIDLAIFAQACSRLMHGSLFSSIRGMNVLGDHSSLVLFLVTPLYAPWDAYAWRACIDSVAAFSCARAPLSIPAML